MAGPRTGRGPLWMTGAEGSLAERQGWATEQHSPVLPSPPLHTLELKPRMVAAACTSPHFLTDLFTLPVCFAL